MPEAQPRSSRGPTMRIRPAMVQQAGMAACSLTGMLVRSRVGWHRASQLRSVWLTSLGCLHHIRHVGYRRPGFGDTGTGVWLLGWVDTGSKKLFGWQRIQHGGRMEAPCHHRRACHGSLAPEKWLSTTFPVSRADGVGCIYELGLALGQIQASKRMCLVSRQLG